MSNLTAEVEKVFIIDSAYKHLCPHCNKILHDPVQVVCGHYLCEDCFGAIEYGSKKCKKELRCPVCKEKLDGDDQDGARYSPDRCLKREISNLPSVCGVENCKWTGCYKQCKSHLKEHPLSVIMSVSKRRATHAVINIDNQLVIQSAPEKLREEAEKLTQSAESLRQQADTIEHSSSQLDYVDRVSANSLHREQLKAGTTASSNDSMKRLSMFVECRSNTLDAQTASEHIQLEVSPTGAQNTSHVSQISQQPTSDQLVAVVPYNQRSSGVAQQPPVPQDIERATPIILPPLLGAVLEREAPIVSPVKRRRRSSTVQNELPTLPQRNPVQVTSSGRTPLSPIQIPEIPSRATHHFFPQAQPSQPKPPRILKSANLPVLRRVAAPSPPRPRPPRRAIILLSQVSDGCAHCKYKDEQIKTLKTVVNGLVNEPIIKICKSSENNYSGFRPRGMSM